MNIENLRRLINGEALNKPSVSAVEGFAFDDYLNGRQIFKTKKAVFTCKKGYI